MNILFIGDIVGKVGRKALSKNLSFLIDKYDIDFTICNGENISNGRGINLNHYNFLSNLDINCITLGNHYHDKIDELKLFVDNENIVRPLNLSDKIDLKGEGSREYDVNGCRIRVTNVLGSVFMKEQVVTPYYAISELLVNDNSDIHIIDFHAEANGEKQCIAHAFKGEVSAIIGTHTHVQTRDAQILDGKTFFISDVGMCGANNGVLGYESESVIDRQIFSRNIPMRLLDDAPSVFSAVVMVFDDLTYKPVKIIPIYIEEHK